jgi:penicillin-binding protein 1A
MPLKKKQPDQSHHIRWFWRIYAGILLLVVLFFTFISWGWLGFMPSFEDLENPRSNLASEIYSADGEVLGKYYIENRSSVQYRELSPYLVQALVATEDARFYKHSGVDVRALMRVTLGVLTASKRGGGSTVSQQLAKNLFPRASNRNFFQLVFIKLKEWVVAIRLERSYSKEEILAMYFNTVDFGSQAFGIKSAARTYFGNDPAEISIEQAALLVGILKAPSALSPVRHPERAMERRNTVLGQMLKYDFIDDATYDSVSMIPIDMSRYQVQDHRSGLATYFREYLRSYLMEWCDNHQKPDGSKYNLYTDGLRIYTTIDSRMQRYAEEAVQEHLGKDLQPSFFKHWKGRKNAPFDYHLEQEEIDDILNQAIKRSLRYKNLKERRASESEIEEAFKTPVEMQVFTWEGLRDTVLSPMDSILYYKHYLQAGMMAMDPESGYIRAYVGGIDYRYFQYDHVIQSRRQVGSTFKPFLYTLAMQEGEYTPCSKVPNVQVRIDLPTGDVWEPSNSSDEREGQMVTLRWALANSVNWISAFLIKKYRPEAVIHLVEKMGVTTRIDPVPSISLGTPDISLYEMVGAFNSYANKGRYIKPSFITHIEDKHGNIIDQFIPEHHEAISEETAYLMIELMKGVVDAGTGVRLRYRYGLNNPIAGKTGTTQNHSDGWFIGLTPELSAGVWVGAEDRSVHFRSISLGQGAHMALPIWALFMKKVYADPELNISKGDFFKPASGFTVDMNCESPPPADEFGSGTRSLGF